MLAAYPGTSVWQVRSGMPYSGPKVPPTAVTHGEEAGYCGDSPHSDGAARAVRALTPSSPELATKVRPRRHSLASSESMRAAREAERCDSGGPQLMECSSGGSVSLDRSISHCSTALFAGIPSRGVVQ